MTEHYEPNAGDLIWAWTIVNTMKEGGVLAFPLTLLIYQFHKHDKTLTLINPEILQDPESAEVHRRTIQVFSRIGYMVLVAEEASEEDIMEERAVAQWYTGLTEPEIKRLIGHVPGILEFGISKSYGRLPEVAKQILRDAHKKLGQ